MDESVRFPPDLLTTCQNLLYAEQEIDLTESESEEKEYVVVEDVGYCTRQHVELMFQLRVLENSCKEGVLLLEWLENNAMRGLKHTCKDYVQDLRDIVKSTYPSSLVKDSSLIATEVKYCLHPKKYVCDDVYLLFDLRCRQHSAGCAYFGVIQIEKCSDAVVMQSIKNRLSSFVLDKGNKFIYIPVNFKNVHWCGIVVDVERKEILWHDPAGFSACINILIKFTRSLQQEGSVKGFTCNEWPGPKQKDNFSCGIFVSWMFFERVLQNSEH